jgi:hypothetical protein
VRTSDIHHQPVCFDEIKETDMTTKEPTDHGYVAVFYRSSPDGVLVYRRDDEKATAAGDEKAHWFCQDERFDRPLTWDALTLTGPLAYVGEIRKVSA